MSTALTDTSTPTEPQAIKSTARLFKWSSYIHVGEGAEECEHKMLGCKDPDHFHAWVRLPNQFQHNEMREKGNAARARKLRILKDPSSDASAVLDEDLRSMAEDMPNEEIITEILALPALKAMEEARADVIADNEEKYKHIYSDLERYQELRLKDPDDRDNDEWTSLNNILDDFHDDIQTATRSILEPLQRTLEGLDRDQMIERMRETRVEQEGLDAFNEAYRSYQWIGCIFHPRGKERPTNRIFTDEAQLRDLADEVVSELSKTFIELQSAFSKGASGNS